MDQPSRPSGLPRRSVPLAVIPKRPVGMSCNRPVAVSPTNHAGTLACSSHSIRVLVRRCCDRIARGGIVVVHDALVGVLIVGIAGYRIARRRVVVIHDPLIGILFIAGRRRVFRTVIGSRERPRMLRAGAWLLRLSRTRVSSVDSFQACLLDRPSHPLSAPAVTGALRGGAAARNCRQVPSSMVNADRRRHRFRSIAVRPRTNNSLPLCKACVSLRSSKRELMAAPGPGKSPLRPGAASF